MHPSNPVPSVCVRPCREGTPEAWPPVRSSDMLGEGEACRIRVTRTMYQQIPGNPPHQWVNGKVVGRDALRGTYHCRIASSGQIGEGAVGRGRVHFIGATTRHPPPCPPSHAANLSGHLVIDCHLRLHRSIYGYTLPNPHSPLRAPPSLPPERHIFRELVEPAPKPMWLSRSMSGLSDSTGNGSKDSSVSGSSFRGGGSGSGGSSLTLGFGRSKDAYWSKQVPRGKALLNIFDPDHGIGNTMQKV